MRAEGSGMGGNAIASNPAASGGAAHVETRAAADDGVEATLVREAGGGWYADEALDRMEKALRKNSLTGRPR
jgi:hypothetical protein